MPETNPTPSPSSREKDNIGPLTLALLYGKTDMYCLPARTNQTIKFQGQMDRQTNGSISILFKGIKKLMHSTLHTCVSCQIDEF